MRRYGQVGYDVGRAGRWFRFGFGLLISAGAAASLLTLAGGANGFSPSFMAGTALALGAITLAYLAGYRALGERLFARAHPWLNTLVLVGPALVLSYWNLSLGNLVGLLLPAPLELGMLAYIGISLVVESFIGYGGCEVVALPILVFRRRYVTYCVPIVMLDAAERSWTESRGLRRGLWVALGIASSVTIVLGIAGISAAGFTGAGLTTLAFLVVAALVAALTLLEQRGTPRPAAHVEAAGNGR